MEHEIADARIKLDRSLADGSIPLNRENEWVRSAAAIPWARIEERYGAAFADETGMPSSMLRPALAALLLLERYGYRDADLIAQLRMNPYYQHFMGMETYSDTVALETADLARIRKAFTPDMSAWISELIREGA